LVTWLPDTLYGSLPADGSAPPLVLDAPPVGGFQEQEEIALPPLD